MPLCDLDAGIDSHDLAEAILRFSSDRILVHIHGGLVPPDRATSVSARLHALAATHGVVPVSLHWHTSFEETFLDEIKRLRSLSVFERLHTLATDSSLRWLASSSGGKGCPFPATDEDLATARREPEFGSPTWLDSMALRHAGQVDAVLETARVAGERYLWAAWERISEDDPTGDEFYPDLESLSECELTSEALPRGKGAIASVLIGACARITSRVLRRVLRATHHGWRETLVEETLREVGAGAIGTMLWDNMKTRAQEFFTPSSSARSSGIAVLQALAKVRASRPGATIDVCGHSAGCIMQCHLHTAAQNMTLATRYAFLLAPACRSTLFEQTILRSPPNHIFLVAMHDDREVRDALLPLVYERSLLYLVSGLLEREPAMPILGLARYLAPSRAVSDVAISRVAAAFSGGCGLATLVLSPTSDQTVNSIRSLSVSHGGFHDDGVTLESVIALSAGSGPP